MYTEVRGGDPGYDETARILSESALCLALDDLPALAGQLTPAAAMGETLTERLRRSGLVIREAARREG
ncbi:membrane protein [Streptomyces sp. SPB074]|nr:membrane protein [Streptomyces sp. SPB074]